MTLSLGWAQQREEKGWGSERQGPRAQAVQDCSHQDWEQALLNPGSSEEDSGSPPPLGWEWEELLLDLKGPAALG